MTPLAACKLSVCADLTLNICHWNTKTNRQQLFGLLHLVAPKPRAAFPSEKTYITSGPDGQPTAPRPLPCWYDRWLAERRLSEKQLSETGNASGDTIPDAGVIDPAELRLSVVLPAYNEEDRILPTLEEAVAYLDEHLGRTAGGGKASGEKKKQRHRTTSLPEPPAAGYEIIVVNDGSKDKTVDVVLQFAREHKMEDVLRVVSLEKNRGKGGGVTHGLRHVRGHYVLFADADGASRFSDVKKLIEGCDEVVDGSGRGVAIGSRAHLVGSEAVVKVIPPPLLFPIFPILPGIALYWTKTNTVPALRPAQLSHALLSPRPHHPHPARYLAYPRHPVRLQALHPRRPPPHCALHARRGLDL